MLVTIITNRKSHIGFRLVPKSVTLYDLERHSDRYFALFYSLYYQIRQSVCPFVCPSVKRVNCDKIEENQYRFLYHTKDHLA